MNQPTFKGYELEPLTPKFDQEQHGVYLNVIESALQDGANIRNIALAGGYGVGKSSVLKKVISAHPSQAVSISFSSIGFDSSNSPITMSVTNSIQKEIVKQLIYMGKPHVMRGSRFHRLSRPDYWRNARYAIGAGLLLAFALIEYGWIPKTEPVFDLKVNGIWFRGILFILLTTLFFIALHLFENKFSLRDIKFPYGEIKLDKEENSFFDKYLDEIVYFFDVSKRDIVIFEDIDRFDDAHIFETLRALNTLLNTCGQLEGRDIRFIYAIKDSIFDLFEDSQQVGKSEKFKLQELVARTSNAIIPQTNRTKFFDLIVPMVPFISQRNSRELQDRLLNKIEPNLRTDLTDLAAFYFPDMRLLKNIHNEFLVFRHMIFSLSGANLRLSQDELYAMILYKNEKIADFELIRFGKSDLDILYQESRKLISQCLQKIRDAEESLNANLSALNSIGFRSNELGGRLRDYLDSLTGYLQFPAGGILQVGLLGVNYDRNTLLSSEFWGLLVAAPDTTLLMVSYIASGRNNLDLRIPISELRKLLNDSLSEAFWRREDRSGIQENLERLAEDKVILADATFKILSEQTQFRNDDGKSFEDLVKEIFNSEMIRTLISLGYLTQNYALYTSNYYTDRISISAMNFLLHNIDRNLVDYDFPLTDLEISAILKEKSDSILRGVGIYNIDFFNYLLSTAPEKLPIAIRSFLNIGLDEEKFLTAYTQRGKYQVALFGELAKETSEVFTFLVALDGIGEEQKIVLIDSALRNSRKTIRYDTNVDLRKFLQNNQASFPVLTSEDLDRENAEGIAQLFYRSVVVLTSVIGLNKELLGAVVQSGFYKISKANLGHILGTERLALDEIRVQSERVFSSVVINLGDYLTSMREIDSNYVCIRHISNVKVILAALEAELEEDAWDYMQEVLLGIDFSEHLIDFSDYPTSTWWSALMDADGILPSFENISRYLEDFGGVDFHLGGFLSRVEKVTLTGSEPQERRKMVAMKVLQGSEFLTDPDIRAKFVRDLNLDGFLSVEEVPIENGSLLGLLISYSIIADDATTFEFALKLDWPSREYAMSCSSGFSGFMSPAIVSRTDVVPILRSVIIPKEIRNILLSSVESYVPDTARRELEEFADFVIETRIKLRYRQIEYLRDSGVGQSKTLELIALSASGLTLDELKLLVSAFGESLSGLLLRNGSRRKLSNTESNREIVDRLKALNQISSYRTQGDEIIVNLKKS